MQLDFTLISAPVVSCSGADVKTARGISSGLGMMIDMDNHAMCCWLVASRPGYRFRLTVRIAIAWLPNQASKPRTAGPTVSQHNTSVYRLVVGLVWFLELGWLIREP